MRQILSTYKSDRTQYYPNDMAEVIEAIEAIGKRGYRLAVPILIELLQTTNNHAIRDAIAVAIRDLRDDRACEPLVLLLKDPKTIGHRGTLLYALEVFDCASILPLLVDLVITGNFEVSHQAFLLIESIDSEIDDQTWTTSLNLVETALDQAKGENPELLKELLDLFHYSSELLYRNPKCLWSCFLEVAGDRYIAGSPLPPPAPCLSRVGFPEPRVAGRY